MTTFKEQMKGFPLWQLVVVCVMRFLEPLAFTSLFPYVYFMIRDFGIAKDDAEISKYAGYLSSSFAFTQFLFTIQWGNLSEKIGRKYVLIIGLTGTSLSMIIFGFAPNYYVALAARSAMGAVNGNIAVLRTVLGEMATQRSHQAVAFSTLPLLWNIGSVIGPLIGGSNFFTRPKSDAPTPEGFGDWHNRFLNKHPYALSNVFVASFLVISAIIGFLFLEETHYKLKYKRDIGLDLGDIVLRSLGFHPPPRPWHKSDVKAVSSDTPLLQEELFTPSNDSDSISDIDPDSTVPQQLYSAVDDDVASVGSAESVGLMTRRMSDAVIRRYSSKSTIRPQLSRTISRISGIHIDDDDEIHSASYSEIFTPPVTQTIISNFMLSFHNIIYSEFLPVFLASKLMADKLKFPFTITGGFGFDSDYIGTLMSTTGLAGVFSVVIIFPYVDRNFKCINVYRFTLVLFPIIHFILPFYIFTLPEYNPSFGPNVTKYLLYSNNIVFQITNALSFPELLLLIHRATAPQHRAFINGAALSLSSLARFIGPAIWGVLMSYFDLLQLGGFTWYMLGVISLLSMLTSFWIKDYDAELKESNEV